MADLMDHPFVTTVDNTDEGELKLTVIDQEVFLREVMNQSEINSNSKQTFTPRLSTMTGSVAMEFTT